MTIDILTLFPNMYQGIFDESIIKRAIDEKRVEINIHNFRDYTLDPVWGKFQNIECLSDEPTNIENINTPSQRPTNVQKLLRNGQLIIVRDGVEYNAMGQEM